ncbi:hypothetical protein L2E82_15915 [Cichorium intybus]|uniref:Uncharacterized protein n=1 Tax=Cichorium intybus TaxID=13427 RepID=A0ACB9F3Q0_CICIN|nr:hypothetical protein L2E82_15915 [Cichorium intybus]
MAEHQQQHYGYQQHQQHYPMDATKGRFQQNGGQSTSKILAVLTLFPIGGVCLLLAGLTLTGTLIGLAVATPVFVIFSPILVPAAITIGLAVAGFLTSGAFGITALSSLTYIVNYFRKMGGGGGRYESAQDSLDYAKRRAQDTAGYGGQKVKDVGQRTQEAARS